MTKVLIVEDQRSSAEGLRRLLSCRGHQVRTSLRASDAIEQGAAFRPDLLITDCDLRDSLNGFDVAKRLREAVPSVAVVFVTGMPRDMVEGSVAKIEGAQLLTKPIDFDRLADVVEAIVPPCFLDEAPGGAADRDDVASGVKVYGEPAADSAPLGRRAAPGPLHAPVYRAIAEILRSGPSRRALDEASAMLGDSGPMPAATTPFTALAKAIRAAVGGFPGDSWRTAFSRISRRCTDPRHEDRLWACVVAEIAPDDGKATDLLLLAALAETIDWTSIRSASTALSESMRERRTVLLVDHANVCLLPLARELASSPVPLFSAMGGALRALLRAEMGHLMAA